MDIFFIFSAIYLLIIFSLTALVFLWILGANKERREAHLATLTPLSPHFETVEPPLPQSQIIPRRLSFSNATPTSIHARPTTPRRVTFNLTPEQQRAEIAKAHYTPPTQAKTIAQVPPQAHISQRQSPLDNMQRHTNAPLLELFESPAHEGQRNHNGNAVVAKRLSATGHRQPAAETSEKRKSSDFDSLLKIVSDEGEDMRKVSCTSEEEFAKVQSRNDGIEAHRPFGFAPSAAGYPFGLLRKELGGGDGFVENFGGLRKRQMM